MPISFPVSLFRDEVNIYEVHNNGGWYNFSLLLGAVPFWAAVVVPQVRRRNDTILGLPGTLANGQYSLTAVAVEGSEVAFVGREALLELIRTDSNNVGFEIIRLLGEEVVRIRELLASPSVQ